MKVAVLYSGQIRGESYQDNIWWMKSILPYADFYFTSWSDVEHDWLDCTFKEPHIPYNSERYIHLQNLQILRKLKDELGEIPQDHKARRFLQYSVRKTGRDRVKQHIAHALAFEKYGQNYDVVIRIRYDLKFDKSFNKQVIDHMINLCYTQKMPVSIGYMGEYEGEKFEHVSHHAWGDVIICHRADMFNPLFVYDLVKQKRLKTAEGGWHQILSEPYNVNAYCASCAFAWITMEKWL